MFVRLIGRLLVFVRLIAFFLGSDVCLSVFYLILRSGAINISWDRLDVVVPLADSGPYWP